MQLFIASFQSSMYPEDNYILGAYSSEEKAEAAIQNAIAADQAGYPDHHERYHQKRYYYSITEATLDGGDTEDDDE